jgi:tetratricopeptide (TPR) repeat protein
MSDSEARALVNERLKVLRIEKLVSDLLQIEPLIAGTGGNPKAIEMTLGLVKYERRSLQDVTDDLYSGQGELFDDLFSRAWALLDEASRRVLLVMTFFPLSIDGNALGATADVEGFAFERAIERLTDLALLDIHQHNLNSLPRYTIHPLVSAFARSKLKLVAEFELPARYRWVEYLKKQLGLAWQQEPFSSGVIIIENSITIQAFSDWSYQNQHWYLFLDIYKATRIAWDISELASQRFMHAHQVLEAACKVNDIETQIRSLLRLARLSSFLRQPEAVEYFTQAQTVWNTSVETSAWDNVRYRLETTYAILLIFSDRAGEALQLLREQIVYETDPGRINTRKYWMGICFNKLNQRKEAIEILTEVIQYNGPVCQDTKSSEYPCSLLPSLLQNA